MNLQELDFPSVLELYGANNTWRMKRIKGHYRSYQSNEWRMTFSTCPKFFFFFLLCKPLGIKCRTGFSYDRDIHTVQQMAQESYVNFKNKAAAIYLKKFKTNLKNIDRIVSDLERETKAKLLLLETERKVIERKIYLIESGQKSLEESDRIDVPQELQEMSKKMIEDIERRRLALEKKPSRKIKSKIKDISTVRKIRPVIDRQQETELETKNTEFEDDGEFNFDRWFDDN